MTPASAPYTPSPRCRERLPLVGTFLLLSVVVACGREPAPPRVEVLFRIDGELPGALLGLSAAALPDIDGDGVPDLALGAPRPFTELPQPGAVVLFSGRDGARLGVIEAEPGPSSFGQAVAALAPPSGVGGAVALLVGAPTDSTDTLYGGRVHLVPASGGDGRVVLSGEHDGDQLGRLIVPVGDVDGDGAPDLAVTAAQVPTAPDRDPGPGLVHLLSGSDAGLIDTLSGEDPEEAFGSAVAALGDVDGDGVDDLAIGAPGRLRVVVVSGRTGAELFRREHVSGGFGSTLASLGDLDGDGIGDLAVGAPLDSGRRPLGGVVHILSGRDGATLTELAPDAGTRAFGSALLGVGDRDGDGSPDLLVASSEPVVVRLVSVRDGRTLATLPAPDDSHLFGTVLRRLADLDGDGRDEILIAYPGPGHQRELPGGAIVVSLAEG